MTWDVDSCSVCVGVTCILRKLPCTIVLFLPLLIICLDQFSISWILYTQPDLSPIRSPHTTIRATKVYSKAPSSTDLALLAMLSVEPYAQVHG